MQSAKKKRLTAACVEAKRGSSSMSEKQRSLMLDYLSVHPNMVCDRSVAGALNRLDRDELWEELACILNQMESGAQKDGAGWRRSWQDLKRYESMKAKESMDKLDKVNKQSRELGVLELSPLQERISHLLNSSITDVISDCVEDVEPSHLSHAKMPQSSDSCFDSQNKALKDTKVACETEKCHQKLTQGDTNTKDEFNIAQALQSIANALTQRNVIEERKLRVFENILTVYATKSGVSLSEAENFGSGQSSS